MPKKFNSRFKDFLIDCISNSLNTRMCNKLGAKIEPLFNIHKVSGISEKMSMQPKVMAKNFVEYFFVKNQEIKLLEELIKVNYSGIDGYEINIYNFQSLLKELEKIELKFDRELNRIIEIDDTNSLLNWGLLQEGNEYSFCFVSVDIVKNTHLAREHNPKLVKETYKAFYNFINAKVSVRKGRIWLWEGDGGIIAFQGEDAVNQAVFSVIDFYLSMPVFNAVFNKVNSIIIPRIAIHYGKSVFKTNIKTIKSDTLDNVREIEKKFTDPGNVVITNVALISLDPNLKQFFKPLNKKYNQALYFFDYKTGRMP